MAKISKYYDVIKFIHKYGSSGLGNSLEKELGVKPSADEVSEIDLKSKNLAEDLYKLGPTFVKIGQLLSSQSDYLPEGYRQALEELQDHVEPVPFKDLDEVIFKELGDKAENIFFEIETEPLASASLAQVHRATLLNGKKVVVKVQRPGIRRRMIEDLEVLAKVASGLDRIKTTTFSFQENLDVLKDNLVEELDYTREANNMRSLKESLAEFEHIKVPAFYSKYSTSRVITQEYIEGINVSKINDEIRNNYDLTTLTEQLLHAFLKQIVKIGFVHADPHPGNILLTPDSKLALIDFGMVLQIPISIQDKLGKIVMAISEGRSQDVASLTASIGVKQYEFNSEEFNLEVDQLVTENLNLPLKEVKAGKVVLDIAKIAEKSALKLPAQFVVLGKTLIKLDNIGQLLDPEFDPQKSIRENFTKIIDIEGLDNFSLSWLYQVVTDSKELICELPQNLTESLRHFATGKFRLDVELQNEKNFIQAIQTVANRISNGIVIAALIIGASLMLDIETEFTILGYPGLAIIFFVLAFILGFYSAVISIFRDK